MSNEPEKQPKTFEEFSNGIVRLNLKHKKSNQREEKVVKEESSPFESDLANLLEQLKSQNTEIKNIGNTLSLPKTDFKLNLNPIIDTKPIEEEKNIQKEPIVENNQPINNFGFDFNNIDPYNSNANNKNNNVDPFMTNVEVNNFPECPQGNIEPIVVPSFKGNINVNDVNKETVPEKKDTPLSIEELNEKPFDFNNSEAFHIEPNQNKNDLITSGVDILQSTNYLLNPKASNNNGFVFEPESEQGKNNKESKNQVETLPIVESQIENSHPKDTLGNEFDFDVNDIVNNLSENGDKEIEEKERIEQEEKEKLEKIQREEQERLERERKEKEEEEQREVERLLKEKEEKEREEEERLERERLEKETRERLERERKEKEERERIERVKREKEKREREEKEELLQKEEEEKEKALNERKKNYIVEDSLHVEDNKNDSIAEMNVIEINDFEFDDEVKEPSPKEENKPKSKGTNPIKETKKEEKIIEEPKPDTSKVQKSQSSLKSNPKPPQEEVRKETVSSQNTEQPEPLPQVVHPQEVPKYKKIKKQLNSLTPDKKEIQDVFDHITNFDIDHPDLSKIDEYPHITTFDRKDPDLHQIIPNFKETLFYPEGYQTTTKRRVDFLNRTFFEKKIIDYQKIFDFTHLQTFHIYTLESVYQRDKSKLFQGLKIINEDSLFNIDSLSDMSPIGEIENYETFIYKIRGHTSTRTMTQTFRTGSHWREVLFDGNSFYRTIMFELLEYYIMTKNLLEIEKIACDIAQETYKDIFTSKLIDYDVVMNVFRLIIEHMKESNIRKAYDVLIKAYHLQSKAFDYGLIAYLRKISFDILSDLTKMRNQMLQDNKEELKDTKINIDAINIFNTDADFLSIILLPYLFEINVNFLWIDGAFDNPNSGIVNLEDKDRKDSIPLITFSFVFSGFVVLYDRQFVTTNLHFNKIIEKTKISLTQLTYRTKEVKQCEVCRKETEQIIFLQQKFTCCSTCLNEHIHKIISKRAKALYLSNFIGTEYATRPIHLKDNFYISNYDYIELYQNNDMINAIYNWIISSCFACNHRMNIRDLKVMKCLCRYCDTCLQLKISKATEDLKVINRYEMSTFEKQICECNKEFDSNEAVKLTGIDITKEIEAAKERMMNYAQTLCMECCKEVAKIIKEGDKVTVTTVEKYKVIKVKQINEANRGIDFIDMPHVICMECYEKEKEKAKTNVKQKGKNNNSSNTLPCKLCKRRHIVGKFDDSREDGKCCGGGCIIF